MNLRSRVGSYFGNNVAEKVRMLRRDAASLEFIVTETRSRRSSSKPTSSRSTKPHYNVLLKDDKSYPFLKLTNEEFPTLIFTRQVVKDGGTYFGPVPQRGRG